MALKKGGILTTTADNLLRTKLGTMAEPTYADFSAALIPGLSRRILGVRIPLLRRLAREWAKEDPSSWLDTPPAADATFEEIMLRGFIIGYARMEWSERRAHIDSFVPYIDNWAVGDCCCATFADIRRHRVEGWEALRPYAESKEEFRQRFAAVMLMDHFLCDEYILSVLQRLTDIHPTGYYAAMGIGWALSICFVKYPELTLPVLRDKGLDAEVGRIACRKILESRRTPDALRPVIKEIIKENKTLLTR